MTKVTTLENRHALKARDVPPGYELIDLPTAARRFWFIGKPRGRKVTKMFEDRYREYRIWETVAGNYVFAFTQVDTEDPEEGNYSLAIASGPEGVTDELLDRVMDMWRWCDAGRRLIQRAGWSLDKVVD